MEGAQELLSAIQRTASAADQMQINQAQDEIEAFEQNPNFFRILQFLIVNNPDSRKHVFVFFIRYIRNSFGSMSEEQQSEITDMCYELSKIEYSDQNQITSIATSLYLIYKVNGRWEEYIEFGLSSNIFLFASMLSMASQEIEKIAEARIAEIAPIAFEIFAQTGLEHIEDIATIFLMANESEHASEYGMNFLEIANAAIMNHDTLTEPQITSTWMIISGLILKGFIQQDVYPSYIEIISNTLANDPDLALNEIDELADSIEILSQENLEATITLSMNICIAIFNNNNGDFPPRGLNIIIESMQLRKSASLMTEQAINLIHSEDLSHRVLGIRIIGYVMFNARDALLSNFDEVKDILIQALAEDDDLVKKAVLIVLVDFDGGAIEAASIIVDLVKAVLPFILHEEKTMCSLAFEALISMAEEIDSDIEGVFANVWEVMEQIPEENLTQYIQFVASILGFSPDVDDDTINALYEWIDVLTAEDKDLTIRVAALSVIGKLMIQQNAVLPELIDLSRQLCELAFSQPEDNADKSDDIVCQGLDFLKLVACHFRQDAIELIQPFIDTLKQYLSESTQQTRIVSDALVASSVYIGFSNTLELLEDTVKIAREYLASDTTEEQENGCFAAGRIARALVPSPDNEEQNQQYSEILHSFFNSMATIIEKVFEPDVVDKAFVHLKCVFRHGFSFDQEGFINSAQELISRFFAGQIACLKGVAPNDSPIISLIVQSSCDFIGKVLQQGVNYANPVCHSLLEWLNVAEEVNLFPITGALSDAVDFCQLDLEIPTQLCQFFIERAGNIVDPDLEHNIAYFLAVITRKFPQLIDVVVQMRPYIESWWAIAIEKESGYQELISNMASLWLSISSIDPTFSPDLLLNSLKRFPPADVKETETQCELVSIIMQRAQPKEICIAAGIALSKLLTENQGKLMKRGMSMECLESTKQLFKALCSDSDVQTNVLRQYTNNKQKRSILADILSS